MQFDASSPIWVQLVSDFQRRMVTGEWEAGTRIPGVRELAVDLGVNPSTVQRALAEMEREGLGRAHAQDLLDQRWSDHDDSADRTDHRTAATGGK